MVPEKIVLPGLTTLKEQVEKGSLTRFRVIIIFTLLQVHITSYSSMSPVITGIPNCLWSGNPITEVTGFRGTTFLDKVMGDVYNHDNKLFILLGSVDHKKQRICRAF